MFALLKKQVLVNAALKDPTELNALAKVAGFASEKLDIASQEIRSGFLSSEALGAHIVADHIALTHASSTSVKQPEVLIVAFANHIAWGESANIDTVVALIVPDDADTENVFAATAAHLQAQASAIVPGLSAGALEKIRRQL